MRRLTARLCQPSSCSGWRRRSAMDCRSDCNGRPASSSVAAKIEAHQTFIRTMAHTQRPSGDGALLVAGMVMGDARTVVEACQVTCAEQLGQAVRCLQNGRPHDNRGPAPSRPSAIAASRRRDQRASQSSWPSRGRVRSSRAVRCPARHWVPCAVRRRSPRWEERGHGVIDGPVHVSGTNLVVPVNDGMVDRFGGASSLSTLGGYVIYNGGKSSRCARRW